MSAKFILTSDHPAFELAVNFHSGQLEGQERNLAKSALFVYHYGSWDLSLVFAEAAKQRYSHLSSCELRLELAEAEASQPKTIKGCVQKKNRISAVTNELCKRGAF